MVAKERPPPAESPIIAMFWGSTLPPFIGKKKNKIDSLTHALTLHYTTHTHTITHTITHYAQATALAMKKIYLSP